MRTTPSCEVSRNDCAKPRPTRPSCDAAECFSNTRPPPESWVARRHLSNIGPLPETKDDAPASQRHLDLAGLHEHSEDPAARSRKESCFSDCNQSIGASKL